MEVVFTAIMGEIVNRSISFLIDKCMKQTAPAMRDQRLHNLQRLLLRVRVIIEEAEGRDITNQAIIHQLNILRKEMYRAYFTMDNLRSQASAEDKSKDHKVSHYFALPKLNSAKRFLLSTGDTHDQRELQQVLNNLNNIIINVAEFVPLLKNYSPLDRQPYSMHLFLEQCMFGRQMEMERVLSFLRIAGPPTTNKVGVLPIVGPAAVGKSTLVAHVCSDGRVRNNFTKIVFITEHDLKNKRLATFEDGGVTVHKNHSVNRDDRLLAIIELFEDVDEDAWKRFLTCATSQASVVKIIITSRSSKIRRFGTSEALKLNFLPAEAYWYFFKVLTFGSADPKDQPKLESTAMEICRSLRGSFIGANLVSSILRDRLNVQLWSMISTSLMQLKKRNISSFADDVVHKKKFACIRISTDDSIAIYHSHESFADGTVPKITLFEVVSGRLKYEGTFEVLAWKSRIPPYNNYMYTCKVQKTKRI